MTFTMKSVLVFSFCVILINFARSNGQSTFREYTEDSHHETPHANVSRLRVQRSPPLRSGCGAPQLQNIEFLLYTRNDRNNPISLRSSNLDQLDKSKPLKIVIHGWFADHQAGGLTKIKTAYLTRYDCNVIMINWSNYGMELYQTACCYLPKIAALAADFICSLGIPADDVHIIGHSLGGQMAGFISQAMKQRCGEVARITGLDPAGPMFQDSAASQRLDETDARFVQVIHTNQGVLGYWGRCGHADFYVNCGLYQPGCSGFNLDPGSLMNPAALARAFMGSSGILCSHVRAISYMAESVNSDRLQGRPCQNCPSSNCRTDSSQVRVPMGEDCPSSARGSFVVTTNSQRG